MSDDRAQLAEALLHLSFAAQRKTPRVGNDRLPTPWDLAHAQIDEHLTLWQLAEDPTDPVRCSVDTEHRE